MDKKVLWVWLSLLFKDSGYIFKKLYDSFGSIEAIYDTDDADLSRATWLFPAFKKRILDKNLSDAKSTIEWCNKYGVEVLTPEDEKYPKCLFQLDDYPAVLYCYGNLPDFDNQLCITVVGTRDMTVYGRESSYVLGYGLAKAGAVVVSGMAKGIDCTTQKGALFANGTTVAVLGCGINVVYPKENFDLMLKIMKTGAVITEFPPFTPPNAFNFPKRNRIMSALSKGTVVVEAGINSGSLITARISNELKRDVYAYPSSVNHYFSKGTNDLLMNDEAKLVTCALDVIEHYLGDYKLDITASKQTPVFDNVKRERIEDFMPSGFWANEGRLQKSTKKVKEKPNKKAKKEKEKISEEKQDIKVDLSSLSEQEKIVYMAFEDGNTHSLDTLLEKCPTLTPNLILPVIVTLQIKGLIGDAPGGLYIKK